MSRRIIIFGVLLAGLGTVQVRGQNLIVNGNFETGTFAGWTADDEAGGGGSWYISTPGATTPLSGEPTAHNASGGNYYALIDETAPGCQVLLQSFTLASAATLTLSYQMFVNSAAGLHDTGTLDYKVSPNQFGQVDLLTGTATPFSTAAADIVQTFYSGLDQPQNINAYTSYTFTILSLAAGTYQLRFAAVENQDTLNMGVDNVSLAAVPEPTTLVLVGLSGLSVLLFRRQRK